MDSIDALIAARVPKPAALAPGEVPVWNGSAWVRSSVTQITANGVTGLVTNTSGALSAAATDLAGPPVGSIRHTNLVITTGGGTLRSIGTAPIGTRFVIRNQQATSITLKHQLAGGVGAMLWMRGLADVVLAQYDSADFIYDGTNWVEVNLDQAAAGAVVYRKNTYTAVNSTVAVTDLFAGTMNIGAGVMGTSKALRIRVWGDWLANVGGTTAQPRFQLVFGGTTIVDTGTTAGAITADIYRRNWKIDAMILNNGTSVQDAAFLIDLVQASNTGPTNSFTTGSGEWGSIPMLGGTTERQATAFGGGTSAIDTTAAQALVLNVINGAASATYETRLRGALVEVV